MAYLSLKEINSNPIYQPPQEWINLIVSNEDVLEQRKKFYREMTPFAIQQENFSNMKFEKHGIYFTICRAFLNKPISEFNFGTMIRIVKKTKKFLVYEEIKLDFNEYWYHDLKHSDGLELAEKLAGVKTKFEKNRKQIQVDENGNEFIKGYFNAKYLINIKEHVQKQSAIKTLQRAWRKCRYDPEYKMCKTVQINNLKADGIEL